MEIVMRTVTIVLLKRVINSHNFVGLHSHRTVDLAYKIQGTNSNLTPIIILHGLLGQKKNWVSMSRKLNETTKRQVITVDARNHGESPFADSHSYFELAADVDKLMDKLQIKEAIVLGHSMGGRTAMVMALSEPTKVTNLIVVDVSPVSFPSKMNNFFPRLMDVMSTVKFEAKDIPAAKEEAKYKLKASGLVEDIAFMEFLLMNIGEKNRKVGWLCNVTVLKKYFQQIASFPTEIAGKVYPGPTLFVVGSASHFVPAEDQKGISSFFPQVRFSYVPEAGHNVHTEKPNDFLSIVSTFVAEYSIK